ncbi:MAG: magnesium transporter MgtE N-terminal domain-containing protein [Thermoleophilia bacterium]
MFFLSKLLGEPLRDAAGKPVGSLLDLVVSPKQTYPRVTALAVKRRGHRVIVAWANVASFEESGSLLTVGAPELADRPLTDDELLLSATFLDKQLVDTDGRKVIRVNDIQLMRTGPFLHVVAVDVSSGAILRRVGLTRVSDRLTKSSKNPRPTLIDWRNVDLAASNSSSVRLTVPRTDLSLLHPADIADLAHELTPAERAAVFDELADDLAADALEEMHPSYQASLLLDLPDDKASELLTNMSPDDAADLLADLPAERAQRLISLMEKDDAADVRELLAYPEHSAGGIMTTDFAWVRLEATAGEALQMLRTQAEDAETVYYVYVLDRSEHLRGVFSLRDLLTAPEARKVREFMTENPVAILTSGGEDEITELIAKYNLLALPVVDENNVLHGIITVDDAIDLILPLAWKKRLPRIFH